MTKLIKLIKLGNLIYENINAKYIDENGYEIWNVPNDETELKKAFKDTIDWYTDRYIKDMFEQQQENLADIVSEQGYLEGRFYINNIDYNVVKNEIFNILAGNKTKDTVITELNIPDNLLSIFNRAIEIATLIMKKENIWSIEAQLEKEIDNMTFDELLNLDVKVLCDTAYATL